MNLAALAVLGGAGVGIGYAIQAACKINWKFDNKYVYLNKKIYL